MKLIEEIKCKNGRIEIYRDRKGEWRWRALSKNGRIVADCGEGYSRRYSMDNGLSCASAILSDKKIA